MARMTPPPSTDQPEATAREHALGAELTAEIFRLGDDIFSSARELDTAIEKLCVCALARYRIELAGAADGGA